MTTDNLIRTFAVATLVGLGAGLALLPEQPRKPAANEKMSNIGMPPSFYVAQIVANKK